jgi:hypothetical protein
MTTIDEQIICNDCLIKPRKFSLRFNQSIPEVPMSLDMHLDEKTIGTTLVSNAPKGEKICEECHQPFKPNSGRQKRCDSCKSFCGIKSKKLQKQKNESPALVPMKERISKSSEPTFIEMGINLLNNIGVTKLKVEKDGLTITIEKEG